MELCVYMGNRKIILKPASSKRLVNILKWSLLPNHYHLLLEEVEDGGVVEFTKRIGNGFT